MCHDLDMTRTIDITMEWTVDSADTGYCYDNKGRYSYQLFRRKLHVLFKKVPNKHKNSGSKKTGSQSLNFSQIKFLLVYE